MKHFACQYCKTQLGGQRYIQQEQKPYCIPCYKQKHSIKQHNKCHTCNGEIIIDQPHITKGTLRWHATANCFCCVICQRNLLGKPYTFHSSRLICGTSKGCLAIKQHNFELNNSIPSSARVRFRLENNKQKRGAPPARSPPPVPKSSPSLQQKTKTPPENIYETVLASSPSTSRTYQITNNLTSKQLISQLRHIKPRPESISDSTEEDDEQNNYKIEFLSPNQNITSRRNLFKNSFLPRSRSADGKRRKSPGNLSKNTKKKNKNLKSTLRPYQNYYSRMPPDNLLVHYGNNNTFNRDIARNNRTYRFKNT